MRGSCQTGMLRLTLDYTEKMSATDVLDQERLGSEDIKFIKTLRRTFESMSKGNLLPVKGEIAIASSQNTPMRKYL